MLAILHSRSLQLTPYGWLAKHRRRLRRRATLPAAAAVSTVQSESKCRHRSDVPRIVFLGTPEVAASTLQQLYEAATAAGTFKVAAVVTQPGRPRGRGNQRTPQPSPVEAAARGLGLHHDSILAPIKASEPDFLARLTELAPDLCVTAAYGNILPQRFLDIPRYGTLNIHPSLLPAYRGAAPVQRALQDGVQETGVSVAFTVRAMDAGPVLAQERVAVDADVQAPELLRNLFKRGTRLLLDHLDTVWSGDAHSLATPQDASQVTHAAKMTKEEGILDITLPAETLHNQVRAFAGWPGTTCMLHLDDGIGDRQPLQLRILRTAVGSADGANIDAADPRQVLATKQALLLRCGDASVLQVLELQPIGKKAMSASAFINGLKGRKLYF